MAQTQYRANLSAKDFPFLADQWGRSVIVKGFDQNFSRQIVSATDPDKDVGIPQAYYVHNVMPSSGGFQSIGFVQKASPFTATQGLYSQVKPYYNVDGTNGNLCFYYQDSETTAVYSLPAGSGQWTYVSSLAYNNQLYKITSATVNGQTYIYIPKFGCYKYSAATNSLTPVTLTGLDPTTIIGITESFGYLIAWSLDSIAWSSTIDPTDFTPSLVTGAGGGSVQELKGQIFMCYRHVFGFVAYSDKNAVACVYSGNARFPFNFREINGAGGLTDPELVTIDPETGSQYAYTTTGLQLVSVTSAPLVFPELTNFVGGSRMEDYNETLDTLVETDIQIGTLRKQLALIASRYLVISYGITAFTHALVYDIAMKRWGKIKINHVASFELFNSFIDPNVAATEARTTLAFMQSDGTIFVVDFTMNGQFANGVMLCGRYQHTRNRTITLQEIDPTTVSPNFSVQVAPTLDGKTWLRPLVTFKNNQLNQGVPLFQGRVTGLNFTLIFKGAFTLDSLVLAYIPNGRR